MRRPRQLLAPSLRRAAGGAVLAVFIAAAAACDRDDGAASAGHGAETDTSPLMQRWCADCHLPPSAATHKARDWHNIVTRMQRHRLAGGLPGITPADFEQLVAYLERHAQP